MKSLSFFLAVLTLGMSLAIGDAEAARRMGGGKSIGMQRQTTTAPDKAPTAAAAPAAAGTAAAAAPKRSWLGPVAGIAAGLGLAALASHLGFGEELASMLLIGLVVVAVLAVVGMVMRRRAAAQSGQGMHYAAAGAGAGHTGARPFEVAMPQTGSGSLIGANLNPAAGRIPADFDVAGFVRNARVQFIRLQAANDAGNLDDIRGFTTPEMFAEIQMEIAERGAAAQATEVVRVDADVLEVAEEGQHYVVSVRFTGMLRDTGSGETEAFDELWHLTKPRQGNAGWALSGIQQLQ